MHVLGYGRVSKLDYGRKVSDEELDTAARQQRSRLERAECTEIFFDIQRGTDDDRPDFEKLVARMQKREKCDRIVITRDDRITRNATMTLELIEILVSRQIELLVLDDGLEPVDFSNPYEWKKRVQAGVDAQFEVKMLSLRIKRGYEYLRSQNKASPAVPFGYQRSSEGKYELHPQNFKIAQQIIDGFFEYRTLRKTCKLVADLMGKEWRVSTLRHWLINEVLRGNTPYHMDYKTRTPQEIIYGTHPDAVLITAEQDIQLRQILDENRRLGGARHHLAYPLGSGLCKCKRCGASMVVTGVDKYSQELKYYLKCSGTQNFNNPCTFTANPPSKLVEARVIDALVDAAIAIGKKVEIPARREETPELRELRKQYLQLCSIPGNNPAIQIAKEQIQEQIRNLEVSALQEAEVSSYAGSVFRSFAEVASDRVFWETLDPAQKREFFRQFVSVVWVSATRDDQTKRWTDHQVEVVLKF